MIRLVVLLVALRSAACVTEASLHDLLADIFEAHQTELVDNAVAVNPPSQKCDKLEGSGVGCYECYYCNGTNTENRLKGRLVNGFKLTDSKCSESVQICCVPQVNILGFRGRSDCGVSNPEGKPRKRRSAIRAVLQGEFPWRAWVYKKNSQTPLCAATFVDEDKKALLTLASCLQGLSATEVEVAFTKGGTRSAVDKIMVHESYRQGNDVNNIAILQLLSIQSTPDWAKPACLPGAAPSHAAPCVTTSAKDIRLNTIMPLRKACHENKTEPPPELTCATAPFNDYDPETASGLYCKEQHVTHPVYILNGIAIKRLDDVVASYVNVWHFTDWIKEKLN